MSLKRNAQSTLKWKRWVAENRQELINSGVPEEIYKNQMRWSLLLQEGFDYEKSWGPEMLCLDEARVLHALLLANSEEFDVIALSQDLEAKFSSAFNAAES
jgi:hypothetical protein|tara:strand:- start:1487 stop:1789 length:303 start_codon:yes stop_codon:yes gene_type:complete